MPGRTITTGSETALCLQPTLPVLLFVGQLPLWGGLLPFFFRPPFSTQIPQSMQRVLQGLEVVPDLPSPKVQPAPCGLIRALQAWCHPGGCYSWSYPLMESWSYRYLPEQGMVAPEYCKCHSQRRTTDGGLLPLVCCSQGIFFFKYLSSNKRVV